MIGTTYQQKNFVARLDKKKYTFSAQIITTSKSIQKNNRLF
jgi:hypothetical protein